MKRSEMLRKVLIDVHCIRTTTESYVSDMQLAEILLKHIESYGMKPPVYTNGEKEIDYDTGAIWEKQHQNWEPEDETK
jgi:hypothetical protein